MSQDQITAAIIEMKKSFLQMYDNYDDLYEIYERTDDPNISTALAMAMQEIWDRDHKDE